MTPRCGCLWKRGTEGRWTDARAPVARVEAQHEKLSGLVENTVLLIPRTTMMLPLGGCVVVEGASTPSTGPVRKGWTRPHTAPRVECERLEVTPQPVFLAEAVILQIWLEVRLLLLRRLHTTGHRGAHPVPSVAPRWCVSAAPASRYNWRTDLGRWW